MSLDKTTYKNSIKSGLIALLDILKTWDGSSGKTMDNAIEKLAEDLSVSLSNAGDAFVKSGAVSVTGNLDPVSIVSSAVGVPAVHVPPTGAPTTSTGSIS